MLVLSRKVGEQIVIGDEIVLVVKRIAGQRVTVGIEAPRGVHIVRGELKPLEPASQPQVIVSSVLHPTWETTFEVSKPR